MKRRIKLSAQIIIIYAAAFLLTGALAGMMIVNGLDDVYLDRLYSGLEAEGKALRMTERFDDSYEPGENTAYIRYSTADNSYVRSDNLHDFIDIRSAELLVNKAAAQQQSAQRYANFINEKLIYYVVLNYRGFFGVQHDDIIIVLTDTKLKNRMVRETATRMLGALLVALASGTLLLFLWVRILLQSIKNIISGIRRMGEDHYRTSMRISRGDEIGDLGESIERMRTKIIENELEKQKIMQGIGHDLKNPIGIIESYAAAIEDDMCEPKKAAATILKQTKRLSERVSKLLGMTRLGYMDMKGAPAGGTDMQELLLDLLGDYGDTSKVRIDGDIGAAQFDGDRESWRIAVENIMDNAVRYAKSVITVTLRQDRLEIANDGKTIEEGYLQSIFKPYEKSRDGKFGLGLSIVAATAQMYGYSAYAENFDGGVRFVISRP